MSRLRTVKAVRGISLELESGDCLGVLGSNGSGKSTLMRALAGLVPIAQGSVQATARPRLLGVGGALRPLLTGRHNIMLGCMALGMTRREASDRVDDVIQVAKLGEAIDRPMSGYSSGMSARLRFAIATASTPEILIVDEALSVGDEAFRRTSSKRIEKILNESGCILFVSHSLSQIQDLCNRALWIEDGRIVMAGDPAEIIHHYQHYQQAARFQRR
ncbi:MAG: ATP-binding cassette domain-containing protein [Acidobacteriota bacterium]